MLSARHASEDVIMRAMLRRATHSLHQSVERRLASLLQRDSLDGYRALLLTYYGFMPPLEDQVFRILGHGAFPHGYELRPRGPLLARDLRALGLSEGVLAAVARCPDIPRIETKHQALGCLYVLEGSTLGGQFLYRHFEAKLPITPTAGGSYLYGDGPETAIRWRRFISVLDAEPATETARNAAIDAACRTFRALEDWIGARLTGGKDG
ncbi:MAG TPA: biliverdin-producing heme oxygenase [Stenomitos sp.]